MNDQRPFQAFIIHAHRRRVVWRVVEHATAGLLCACGISAIVLPIAWWRDIDSIGSVAAIMLTGIIAGIVASIWRRPTLLDTAGLVEQQLNSPELISSALLTANSDFAQALHAMADARVTGVTLTSLVLRRFGLRMFLGAGLASVSVLVVALMTAAPLAERTAVASDSSNPVDRWVDQRLASKLDTLSRDASDSMRAIQSNPDSADANRSSDSRAPRGAASRNGSTNNNGSSATGSGAARSDDADVQTPESNRTNTIDSNTGTLVAGGNGISTNDSFKGTSASGIVAGAQSAAPIAPWQSSTWSLDRDVAMQAVRSGAVPDSYRALVIDYFERR